MTSNPSQSAVQRFRLNRRIDDLPGLPRAVIELTKLNPSQENFSEEVARIASIEPAIAARVTRIANSAQSGPAQPVISLPGAITRVGAHSVSALITSMSVMRVFVATTSHHLDLWRHSIQVAVFARDIATDHAGKVDPQVAYLAGLLHDIGRFVMFEHEPNELGEVNTSGWSTPEELIAAENAICGMNHADVGANACRAWELPQTVGEIVQHHHALSLPNGATSDLVAGCLPIVQQADHLSCLLLRSARVLGLPQTERRSVIAATCSRTVGTPPATPTRLAERLDAIVAESSALIRELGLEP